MPDQDPISRLNAALDGRYRIERQLGEGGMATVYLADDLKHERQVALKVLKPELAAVVGAERFLAEIKTTAKLQHPHVLPLFDSGQAGSFLFYVMPYVEGESLREKLDREKQLGVDDALDLTKKVADALDYAHGKGVVHRDIKPGNVLLSERGEPLVADFGIALAVAQAGGGRITETGLSLGTPHYMAPEQATGDRDVDARADVYSLGCVLYEMLAGEPPFSASTAQAILAKILTMDAPSITMVRRTVPPNVSGALARALEKLPADRFTSAAAFAAALSDEGFLYEARARRTAAVPTAEHAATAPRGAGVDRRAFAVASVVAIAALGLAAWGWLARPPVPPPGVPTRSELTGLEWEVNSRVVISPDGRWMVAEHEEEAGLGQALYIRRAGDSTWRRLDGTDGASGATFSPDGEWVAFGTQGRIWRVPSTGGEALPVTSGRNPHWGLPDAIVYLAGNDINRVQPSGDDPEVLFDELGTNQPRGPFLLPNGKAVLFSTVPDERIMVAEIETGQVRELVASGNNPRFVSTGYILYGHADQELRSIRFDPETLQTTGSPVTVSRGLGVATNGWSNFSVSESGTLILGTAAGGLVERQLAEVDFAGVETPLPIRSGPIIRPRYSPDGSRIAYEDGSDIRIYDVASGESPVFATGRWPVWSSSGEYLYFTQVLGADGDIYRKRVDGSDEAARVSDRPGLQAVIGVTPDDSMAVVYEPVGQGGTADILLLRFSADGVVLAPFLATEWREDWPSISPDGHWVAYQSNQGQGGAGMQIYVHSFPSFTDRPYRVSELGGGGRAVWHPDGHRLFYPDRERAAIMSVDVTTEPAFSASSPRVLFEGPEYGRVDGDFDVHPDGSRFVVSVLTPDAVEQQPTEAARFYIVTNWFEQLRGLMGES